MNKFPVIAILGLTFLGAAGCSGGREQSDWSGANETQVIAVVDYPKLVRLHPRFNQLNSLNQEVEELELALTIRTNACDGCVKTVGLTKRAWYEKRNAEIAVLREKIRGLRQNSVALRHSIESEIRPIIDEVAVEKKVAMVIGQSDHNYRLADLTESCISRYSRSP